MNKIEKLIKELCPNGVEWKKLGEIGTFVRGNGLLKSDFTGSGFPCIHYGQIHTYYGLSTKETKSFCSHELASKLRKAKTGDLIIATTSEDVEACCKATAWLGEGEVAISGDSFLYHHNQNPLYIAYMFETELFAKQKRVVASGAKVVRVSGEAMAKFEIPLPPLPIQTEIVRILDKFVEQQEQLERLIELRKKQYEYYREEMLKNVNGERGKLIDLLIQPITDGPHVTPKFVDEGVPFISATAIYDGKIHLKDAQGFVTKDFDKECSKKYKPKKFDVYMVKSGSTTGKVALVDFDDDFNVWSPLAAMRTQNEIQAKYLYHLLQTSNIQNQVLLGMSQGSQPNLSMRTLEQFNVIIPNNEEQERIVNVLDKIESNVFIMKSALEASKKRYEYYRDKMMRF